MSVKPILAIAYDFDGTLLPGNMQEHQFIPDIGLTKEKFWQEVDNLAEKHEADATLVYMNLMLEKAQAAKVPVRRQDFKDKGKTLAFFPGVLDWFDRIDKIGKECGVTIEHYIISSGNAEIIAGTPIAVKFKKVFASKFLFDANGVPVWPALAVNYTNKTQFLFRINKGFLRVNDMRGVNKVIPLNKRVVPFANMVFIGDGETDIPCFRLVKNQGGLAIAVYKPKSSKGKKAAEKLLLDDRVNLLAPADYSDSKKLEKIIKAKIELVGANVIKT